MNNSWRKAERIFVLREGTIAEEGSHEQLMAKGGLYARMYGAQADINFMPKIGVD